MVGQVMTTADLQRLVDSLTTHGYEIIGPTIRDQAIVYSELHTINDLPIGYEESQNGGKYRLRSTSGKSLFSYTMGPQSWKQFLLPPEYRFLEVQREQNSFAVTINEEKESPRVFLGVRACELAALKILDRIELEGPYVSTWYQKRRENTFIIAVNCIRAGDTCFCASMKTGPRVTTGYDILLTELTEAGGPCLLAEFGSERGLELLQELHLEDANEEQRQTANDAIDQAAAAMGRSLNMDDLPDILRLALDDRHWDEIAQRCLCCGNCTMVCPTCFCSTTEDTTDLSGQTAERVLKWDSCHTMDFSYIHGGSIRTSVMSRYRQWMMHKLAYWVDQFGTMGCVGCGRCIVWCPVGIDITEEAAYFRESVVRK